MPLLGHESQKRGTLVAEAPIEIAGEHWTVGAHMLIDAHASLDNWSMQLAPGASDFHGGVDSPSFQATDDSRWQVWVEDVPSSDFVGIRLRSLDARLPGQVVNFSITLHNHLDVSRALTKVGEKTRYDSTALGSNWGWSNFIGRAGLEAAGFSRNGVLSISARVDMIPRQKLRLALRRNNASASPLLANLSITPVDGAAVQDVDNVEYFEPLSNVDSFQRFSGAHNHQFRSDHPEASVWMDVDRLNETGTSFLQDGSLLVMVGMQLQPVIDGAFTWLEYDFPLVQPTKLYSPVFQSGPSNQKWCAVAY